MNGQLPGIVIAWSIMAFFSFVAAAWIGIGTWAQQEQLQADIDNLQSLQIKMAKEPLPKRFRVLNLEEIGEEWSERIQSLESTVVVLDSVELARSNPVDGSDLVEHLVVVKIQGVSLAELQQLLNGKSNTAEIAEIAIATPKLPMQTTVELWDVRLTLTQISLGG